MNFNTKEKTIESINKFLLEKDSLEKEEQLRIVDEIAIATVKFGINIDNFGGEDMSEIGKLSIDEFKGIIAEQVNTVKVVEKSLKESEIKINELTIANENLTKEKTDIETKFTEAKNTIDQLDKKVNELTEKTQKYERDIEDAQAQIKLNSRLEKLTGANVDTKSFDEKKTEHIKKMSDEDFDITLGVLSTIKTELKVSGPKLDLVKASGNIDLKVIDDDPKPKIINMVMAGIKQHTKLG